MRFERLTFRTSGCCPPLAHRIHDDAEDSVGSFVLRKAFLQALIYQQSFVLVDFPRVDEPGGFQNRAEEDAAGKSRAYLVNYTPLDIPNYKLDAAGNLEWVVIRTKEKFQASPPK